MKGSTDIFYILHKVVRTLILFELLARLPGHTYDTSHLTGRDQQNTINRVEEKVRTSKVTMEILITCVR